MAPSFETHSTLSGLDNADYDVTGGVISSKSITNGNASETKKGNSGCVLDGNSSPRVADLDIKAYTSQDKLLPDIFESMKVSGGCVLRNLVDIQALRDVEAEVRPYLDKAEPWNGRYCIQLCH